MKAYSAELMGKNADLIDHLDRVLRSCEYRDRALAGENGHNMTAGVEYSYFVAYNLRISGTFAQDCKVLLKLQASHTP